MVSEDEPWEARALAAMRELLEAYDKDDQGAINDALDVMQNLVAEKSG